MKIEKLTQFYVYRHAAKKSVRKQACVSAKRQFSSFVVVVTTARE
jgi:hypothetical protein